MVTWEGSQNFWNEARSFWGEAFAWQGAATPRVLPPLAIFSVIATIIFATSLAGPYMGIPAGPHEIAGALLGLILVVRTNSGYERWWEARQRWGGIVSQTRNLATIALAYGPSDPRWRGEVIRWTIAFAHVGRRCLRGERETPEVATLLGRRRATCIATAIHMPNAVSRRIGALLREAYVGGGLDGLAFSAAEAQRTTLIEHIGDCERILMTPLPRAYSIEIRRSIVLFLLTLIFAMLSKDLGWITVPLTIIVAYAILSLDLIGSSLQNPFAPHNLGALPLDDICVAIEVELLGLLEEERGVVEDGEEITDPWDDDAGDPGPVRPPSRVYSEAPSGVETGAPPYASTKIEVPVCESDGS